MKLLHILMILIIAFTYGISTHMAYRFWVYSFAKSLSLHLKFVLQVLFVSPERFLNEEFLSIISTTSPVSLVVVDEAHCISEW